MISLAVATGPAGADPTESGQPPAPSEPPPSSSQAPPSSESSAPPTESPVQPTKEELPATAAVPTVDIKASFDKPSATHSVNVVGKVGDPGITVARLSGAVFDESGSGAGYEFTTPVTPRFGHAGGTVFGDENGNGRFDSGEALPGATLTITNQLHDSSTFTATTDAEGRFEFPRVPTAPYFFSGQGPDGWLIGFRSFTVDESNENDNLLVRAVRPLTGIVANCNRSGEGPGLKGRGPGWGDLAGDGVTIGARETKTLEVSEEMPANAANFGFVHVGCDFSYKNVDADTNPSDFDRAEVPGR